MDYGLKYQSIFYNVFGTEVSVYIYKKDYEEAIIDVRTREVIIECNYQDENTPIIGTGAKVVLAVDTSQMTQYEDLLTSLEKEFKCIIVYGDIGIVFTGYSLCDLNERQFLAYASVVLQFTDYLRRLESIHFPSLVNAGSSTTLISLLNDALDMIEGGEDPTLLVNSTLFEERMDQGATDDFLMQTYFDNSIFYTGPTEYDDGYVSLNKALLSFGAHLYSYAGNRWVLERQEDVLRDGDWLVYIGIGSYPAPDVSESQKQVINKQDSEGGFDYVEMSQIIAYESGLRTLELDLKDKQLDSFVFNDYTVDNMISVPDFIPNPGTLNERQWYYHENCTIVGNNFAFRGMSSYIKWMYASNEFDDIVYAGLYYAFEIQFPETIEDPVSLNVSYKMSTDSVLPVDTVARMRFMIMVDGGPRSGDFLYYSYNYPDTLYLNDPGADYCSNRVDISIVPSTKYPLSVDMEFNLTDTLLWSGFGPPSSVWELLGKPIKQKFIIMFFPMAFIWTVETGLPGGPNVTTIMPKFQYLGDVQVNVANQKVLNKLTYYINEDFEKTEKIDIDFFDLPNINFANGLMVEGSEVGDLEKTENWVSRGETTPVALMDIFAMNKFRIYSRTIHRLKGTIRYNGYIKPFAILTDDNLKVNGENVQLILHGYSWDLNNGTYDIDAQEYSDEDVDLETIANSFGYEGDPGIVPPVPTGLDATINIPENQIDVSWDSVEGAVSYILRRKPYYDIFGNWVQAWQTVYEGPNTSYLDQFDYPPTNGESFWYMVLARTTLVNSAYSAPILRIWS